jgi:endo-1,4-beta-xylanase
MRRSSPPAGSVSSLGMVFVLASMLAVAGCASTSPSVTAPTFSFAASAPTAITSTANTSTAETSTALRDLARSRYFGSALALPQLEADSEYAQIAGAQFSEVTPENAMKWGPLEPSKGQFQWADADAIVAFAQAHDQKIRGHTLVWYQQLPDWISGGAFDKAQLTEILRQHIATEVGRYAGKIYAWDVANEVLADDGSMRDDVFLRTIGQEYIADAFRWAHAADPNAKLYINDYDVEGINPKSDALYNLAKSLKEQGVPVDGVGIQAHFDANKGFPTDMKANLQRFADLGLDVAITELDVRIDTPATTAELTKQAEYYGQTVAACLAVSRCVGVTVWGFTDKYSWVPMVFSGQGAADLYDSSLGPKPALAAVQEALAGH